VNGGHEHPDLTAPGSRSWKHLRRVFPYLRRYWHLSAVSVGLMLAGVAVSLAEPWPMAFLVDTVLGRKAAKGWVAHLFSHGAHALIVAAAIFGLVLALASNCLNVVTEYVSTKLDNRLRLDFRRDLFRKAQQASLSYHDTHRAGYFAQNINTHTTALGRIVVEIPALAQSVLTLIGMFVIALRLDPLLALLSLAVVPFIYYSTVFYARHVEPRLIHTRDQEGLSLSVVHEAMQMLRVILAFRREEHELRRFSDQAEHAINLRIGVTITQTVFSLAVNVITAAGTALVLGFGAAHVLDHKLTVGELLVMMGYIASVYRPLQTISYTMGAWQEQLVDFWLALELLDQEPGITERPDAVHLDTVEGRVTFDAVGFSYPSRNDTLAEVSFDVPAGSVVAVVGPTGAGKTTLTNLIPRFYDASAGRVLIDGHDVRDLTLDSLRLNVAMVLQEPLLFLASIADNIRYGRLDASLDEVMEAARLANAHDFIMALPQGYDTKLGERGAMLSGGERQRICIARAFLKDAPILILDEPTSSIDSRTEGVILAALDRLMTGRTTFIVAHRLSTIGRATTILVLDKGRLVEQGRHDDLVKIEGGLYRSLWEAQTGRPPAGGAPAALPAPVPPAPPALPAPAAPASPAPSPTPTPAPAVAVPAVAGRPKAVVLGMMSKMPVAGVVWQTAHYLVGLERLGFDAYYVEAHARTPSMLMSRPDDDSSALAAQFIAGVMRRFGLDHRWAFQALHADGRCYGLSEAELERLYAEAAVIFNLHGGTEPRPEHVATGRLVYIESDPCQLQAELAERQARTIEFLEPHVAFFTFGENLGQLDCRLPVPERFAFRPTRQPVLVDLWESRGIPAGPAFTTIGNWRQAWRDIQLDGETYHWSKHHEFLRFLDLPALAGVPLELALASFDEDDRALLEGKGWGVREAIEVSRNLDRYRAFIAGSRGEFTVAKDQNVRLRSGWFSDRSATYLAAGRPVVTQDTGFGAALPTGAGLFAFTTLLEAAEALHRIEADYAAHSAAAWDVARGYFSADKVLGDLLGHLDLAPPPRRAAPWRPPAPPAAPPELSLTPQSRRPLVLAEATAAAVIARRPPGPADDVAGAEGDDRPTPAVSVVVVTWESLPCTRLCLESVLAAGGPSGAESATDVEVVVVDNASTDGTPAYLERLALADPRLRVIRNGTNRGFAAAANQGIRASAGEVVVLLNNDTIVAPGWLAGLTAHLADPAVGAVGPVTNRIGNEAEIPVDYDTYGEFLAFAAGRTQRCAGQAFEIPRPALFCLALRRAVIDEVGLLDEDFGTGLFEDDDYAERLRRAGYLLLCAEDVVVHHFGEASFGRLVPTGEHARLFEDNRRRFEEKWGVTWTGHHRREDPAYRASVDRIRATARRALPAGASVLVVSKGDDDLLDLGHPAAHFPAGADGDWAGHHPGSGEEVVAGLGAAVEAGATHLLVPAACRWWLTAYTGLAGWLADRAAVAHDDDDCIIFALVPAADADDRDDRDDSDDDMVGSRS